MREFLREEPEDLLGEQPGDIFEEDFSNTIYAMRPPWWRRVWRRLRTYRNRIVLLVVLTTLGLGTYSYVTAPASVSVVTARSIATTETLGATGRVTGNRSTDLGLDTGGIVSHVYVKEGDTVKAGTVLLSVDRTEGNAGVDSARAALESAQADLAKVKSGPLPSEIRGARAEIAQADAVGAAKVSEANAHYRDLVAGPRSQEIGQAQAQLASAKAVLSKAKTDLDRTQRLVNQGAVARAQLDEAKTNYETARANVAAQQQALSALRAGSRPEVVAQAKASVSEAEAAWKTGVQAAREKLNTLLASPRPEDVSAATAKVQQAQAELRRALAQNSRSELKAPYDGVVADLPVHEGQAVSPGQKLGTFDELSKPVIEVETDEENLSTLAPGMKAIVTADAYPGRKFQAVLYDLGSNADPDRGTVTVKLRPTKPVPWLRPDLTMNVNIVTKSQAERIILPPDAITRVNRSSAVLVVRDGVARPVTVTTGAVGAEGVAVKGHLKNGDQVIRNASLIAAGEDVQVVRGK